jgi:hypothetical protein
MTTLDIILEHKPRQLTIDDLLAEIEAEEGDGDGLQPGDPVGHVERGDFRAIYVGPGRRPDLVLVRVTAGWRGPIPAWPVSIPRAKVLPI